MKQLDEGRLADARKSHAIVARETKRHELLALLEACVVGPSDPEEAHARAETLLCEMWRAQGDDHLAEAWEAAQAEWWYA